MLKKNNFLNIAIGFLFLTLMAGCQLPNRGLDKIELARELKLGASAGEILYHWYMFSKRPLQSDSVLSNKSVVAYRGISYHVSVSGFYIFFNMATRTLVKVEFMYRPSMAKEKEKSLLKQWTKALWKPEVIRQWGGQIYLWQDKYAQIKLYVSNGICYFEQLLTQNPVQR
jgi:hypothetical protein